MNEKIRIMHAYCVALAEEETLASSFVSVETWVKETGSMWIKKEKVGRGLRVGRELACKIN